MEEKVYSRFCGRKVELVKSTRAFLTALKDPQETESFRQDFLSQFPAIERIDPLKDSGLLVCHFGRDVGRDRLEQLMSQISRHPGVKYVTPAFRFPGAPDEQFMLQGDRIVAQFPRASPDRIEEDLQRKGLEIIKALHYLKNGYLLRVKEEAHKTAIEKANEINEEGLGTAEVDWLRIFSPR